MVSIQWFYLLVILRLQFVSLLNEYSMIKKSNVLPNKAKKGFFSGMKTSFLLAILIAVGFRSLLFEPFNIPSGSMLPTLLEGDFIFVTKPVYGYSRYSFPFGVVPLPKSRILGQQPKRGDVVVFKYPVNPKINYIKRVMGVPGDRIQMKSGVVLINGKAVKRERVDDFNYTNRFGEKMQSPQYRETLPGGASYLTLDLYKNAPLDNTQLFVVPDGYYFVMGDNRDSSLDSRVFQVEDGVGMVPAENIVGRADLIWYSTASSKSLFPHLWDNFINTRLWRLFSFIE